MIDEKDKKILLVVAKTNAQVMADREVRAMKATHRIWHLTDIHAAAGLPQGTECWFLEGWHHLEDARYILDYAYYRNWIGFDYEQLKDELSPVQTVGMLMRKLNQFHPDTPLGLHVYGHTYYSFAHRESHGALKLIALKFPKQRLRTLMISVGDLRNIEHDCYGAKLSESKDF